MPAMPSVSNAVRLTLKGLINGTKPWVNSFHAGWSVGAGLSATEVAALATILNASWGTNITPWVTNTLVLNEAIATALDSPTAPEASDNTVRTGADTGAPCAAGTAFVVQRKVDRRYRGGHSRVYIPSLPVHALAATADELLWDATYANDLLNAWRTVEDDCENYLIAQGRTDAEGINISYFSGFTNFTFPSGRIRAIPKLRVTPIVDVVTNTAFNPRPCSQRRRQQAV